MNRRRPSRTVWAMALGLLCVMVLSSTAAFAHKSGSGGGGASGGNSGGGSGGGGAVITTVPITMNNHNKAFNTAIPKGTVTFAYSKDMLTKSLSMEISNIDALDGTTVIVQVEEALRVTGNCWHYEDYYYKVAIKGGKASLSLDTANSNVVPLLDPKKGWTQVSVIPSWKTGVHILDGLLPFEGAL